MHEISTNIPSPSIFWRSWEDWSTKVLNTLLEQINTLEYVKSALEEISNNSPAFLSKMAEGPIDKLNGAINKLDGAIGAIASKATKLN